MMDISNELSIIVAKMKERSDFVTRELQACPNGQLSYEHDGKKCILMQEYYERGKRHRHKLSNDLLLAEKLLRKHVLQDEKASLSRNIALLENALMRIDDFSETAEAAKLVNRFPGIEQNLLQRVYNGSELSAWAREEYEQSNYKQEEKKQINSHGLKLRSKSEVLISEKLYEYDIDFRYEQVVHIGQINLNPDFTIRRKDGKMFIWEHEGLTNVKSYVEWQIKKAMMYAGIGYVPWDNLITTYDNADGVIDLRVVEHEIKNKLLI